jgi:hypothetical protein
MAPVQPSGAAGLLASIGSVFSKITTPLPAITTERSRYNVADARLFDIRPIRLSYYKDFDEMDSDIVELSSALDIYADFVVTSPSSYNDQYTVEIEGPGHADAGDLFTELEDTLELKERAWFMTRNVCKYGDAFYEIVCAPTGVVKLKYLSPYEIYVHYDKEGHVDREWPYEQRDKDTQQVLAQFAQWEMLHLKVGEADYGVENGVLSHLRRAYRILRMLEDTLLVTRIVRSNQRGIYKVDCSGMGEKEATEYIRKLKLLHKKKIYFDSTGKLKTELDPLAPQEDIYIPIRKGGQGGDYTVVGGEAHLGEIADVEHFHNKLFAGTKVPKAYLGFEGDVNAKATLVEQHTSFVKVVRRFRYVTAKGLKKIYSMHLLLRGVDPAAFPWKVKFPNIGSPDETAVWNLEQAKAAVVTAYGNLGIALPMDWVIRKMMMSLTSDEADELISRMGVTPDEPVMIGPQFQMQMQQALSALQGPAPPAPGEVKKVGKEQVEALKKAVVNNPTFMRRVFLAEQAILAKRRGENVKEEY